jgi:acyl-CoA hydrolase
MSMVSESILLVRPEHLNHHGYLFGGRLLEWLDEQAYIAASLELEPDANLVTVAIDRVEFKHSVVQGSMLRFRSRMVHVGHTSVTVFTQVFLRGRESRESDQEIFRAHVSFVCLDSDGEPFPVAGYLRSPFSREMLESDATQAIHEARLLWDEVEAARTARIIASPKSPH